MKSMITIFADEGKILTDEKIYGEVISLAVGKSAEEFTEITREEYEKRMAEQENENGVKNYINQLKQDGVL